MSYRIELVPEARAEIKALPGHVRCQALELVAALSRDPRPARAAELESRPAIYRIWLARRWRVAYEIGDETGAVLVLCVRRNERIDFDSMPWLRDASRSGYDIDPAQIQGRGGD